MKKSFHEVLFKEKHNLNCFSSVAGTFSMEWIQKLKALPSWCPLQKAPNTAARIGLCPRCLTPSAHLKSSSKAVSSSLRMTLIAHFETITAKWCKLRTRLCQAWKRFKCLIKEYKEETPPHMHFQRNQIFEATCVSEFFYKSFSWVQICLSPIWWYMYRNSSENSIVNL